MVEPKNLPLGGQYSTGVLISGVKMLGLNPGSASNLDMCCVTLGKLQAMKSLCVLVFLYVKWE